MPLALVALGSNLGDRAQILAQAARWLGELPHASVLRESAVRETSAVGGPPDQGAFLNSAVLLQTQLAPRPLLQELQALERRAGRAPAARWGPRPLDLDLLFYDDIVLAEPALTLPHPRLAFRRFVLQPAAEVAPRWVHPLFRRTLTQLWEHLLHAPPLVLLVSTPDTAAAELLAACPAQEGLVWLPAPRHADANEPLDEAATSAYVERVLRALAAGDWVVADWRALASDPAPGSLAESALDEEGVAAAVAQRWPLPKAVVRWHESAGAIAAGDAAFPQPVRGAGVSPVLDLALCEREEVLRQLLALVAGMR